MVSFAIVKWIDQGLSQEDIVARLKGEFGDEIQPTHECLNIFLFQLEKMRIIKVTKQ